MAGIGGVSSCGACKFLRRKCASGCVFAPYFSYDQGATHFAAVHKVFGASNVSKLLLHLPAHHRGEAAVTVSFEAQARMRDPVYGCVAYIFALQQQIATLQDEIESLTAQLANATNEVISCGKPQTVEDLFQSTQLFLQKDQVNLLEDHLNPFCPINATGVFQSFADQESLEELRPVYDQLEAIENLDHGLFSDFADDERSSWEEFSFNVMDM